MRSFWVNKRLLFKVVRWGVMEKDTRGLALASAYVCMATWSHMLTCTHVHTCTWTHTLLKFVCDKPSQFYPLFLFESCPFSNYFHDSWKATSSKRGPLLSSVSARTPCSFAFWRLHLFFTLPCTLLSVCLVYKCNSADEYEGLDGVSPRSVLVKWDQWVAVIMMIILKISKVHFALEHKLAEWFGMCL